MSDDVTARITEALARRVSCGATGDRYLVGGEARPLLAEARDEITRLREGIERAIDAYDPYGDHQIDALRALLDAPSTASPVRDGTNTERDEP